MHLLKCFQKILLRVWNFTRDKLCHRSFVENFSNKYSWEHTGLILLMIVNGWLMLRELTDLNFKWREFEIMPSLLTINYQDDISIWILRTQLYPPAEAHSRPSQASKMELFAIIINNFKLLQLTIFAKYSIADVWWGPQYTSGLF